MNMIRNLIVALVLTFIPVAAIAQDAPVCETKAQVVSAVASMAVQNNLDVKTVELTGLQAKAFIDALVAKVGPPPSPASSVLIFMTDDVAMLVFFDDAGCSKFMVKTTPLQLMPIIREAGI